MQWNWRWWDPRPTVVFEWMCFSSAWKPSHNKIKIKFSFWAKRTLFLYCWSRYVQMCNTDRLSLPWILRQRFLSKVFLLKEKNNNERLVLGREAIEVGASLPRTFDLGGLGELPPHPRTVHCPGYWGRRIRDGKNKRQKVILWIFWILN